MTEHMSPGGDDLIASAFEQMREASKKRNGKAPDLGNARLNRSVDKKQSAQPRLGQPTGKDGRALPPRDRMEGISSVMGNFITHQGWNSGLAGGWVKKHWGILVGEKVATHTNVEMLKETTLFITCDSTAWATNLRLMQREILAAIAQEVGANIITELKIFGPEAPSWRYGPLHVKGRGPRDTYG